MKTSVGTNTSIFSNISNLNPNQSLDSEGVGYDPSVQDGEDEIKQLLKDEGIDSNAYEQLSSLIGEARKQGISVDDLLRIYPEFAKNKDILDAMMQQQLNKARMMSDAPAATSKPMQMTQKEKEEVVHIANFLLQMDPHTTREEIAKSGIFDSLAKLSPLQQNALYGILAVSRQDSDTKNLKPTQAQASLDKNPSVLSQTNSLASTQDLLQNAENLLKSNQYEQAYEKFSEALKKDPSLATKWPTIYYQLGVSSEFATNPALHQKANGFYKQYLQSQNPDPKIAAWVQKESQWLTDKPQAESTIKDAQNQMYKEQNAAKAFSELQSALKKFPQLASRQPDIYYDLALYAYSAANVTEAKKYLKLAKTAMEGELKQDPNSKYAQYWMQQIQDLLSQVKDPYSNLSTTIASFLGDKMGGRGIWQEIFNGISNGWFTAGRLYEYTNNAWESKQTAYHWDSKSGATGFVTMDSGLQKQELDELNAYCSDAKSHAHDAEKELKTLQGKEESLNKKGSDKNDVTLQALQQQIAEVKKQKEHLDSIAQIYEENRQDFINSFKGKSYGSDRQIGRELTPIEQKELYQNDMDIRQAKIALVQAESPEAKAKAAAELNEYQKGRTDFIEAAKQGEFATARHIAKTWKDTLDADVKNRDGLKAELAKARKDKGSKAEIKSLQTKLTAAEKNVQLSQKKSDVATTHMEKIAAEATSLLTPEQQKNLETAQNKYREVSKKTADLIQKHDQLVDQLNQAKTDKKPTTDIENQLKANADELKKLVQEGKTAQKGYQDTVEHQRVSPKIETIREGKVGGVKVRGRRNSMEDMNQLGPGWWGMGTTLDHQQAATFQWHLAANKNGKLSSDWRGPFATTSKNDPTQTGVTIASGGKGLNKYNMSINGGVNIGNVEHRDYDMVFGGTTSAGKGVGGMVGSQARTDVIDEQFGLNYQGSDTSIGGEKIKNLVTLNASEQGAVGAQGDADVSAGVGWNHGFNAALGAGAGGFAGAQIGGMAGGSVDGVGGNVMAQGWAGAGIKANIHASFSHGKLNLDMGEGAALGIGGYMDENVTIDFNKIGQEIKGIGTSGVDLAKKWGDKVPGLGQAAGFIAGTLEGAAKFELYTANAVANAGGHLADTMNKLQNSAENIAAKKLHLGVAGKLAVRAGALTSGETEIADTLAVGATAKKAAKQSMHKDLSDTGHDITHGHVVKAAEETLVGGVVNGGKAVVTGFKKTGSAIRKFFRRSF